MAVSGVNGLFSGDHLHWFGRGFERAITKPFQRVGCGRQQSSRQWASFGTMRRDHYVPKFILRRFQKVSRGKVYFAEKGEAAIRLMPVKDIFFQDHGERILARPPKIKQQGERAILASEPEWTESASEALQKLENNWARAITGMISWTKNLENSRATHNIGLIEVKRGPNRQEEWVQDVVDYCLRAMFRSEEVGQELWDKRQESEEQYLHNWIERELGKRLTPSEELQNLYRQHNRSKTRTGALTDLEGVFRKRNSEFTVGIWRIVDNTRFIIGSKGGCRVEQEELNVHLFPVDPKLAVSLFGRREANAIFGENIKMGNPRTIVKHDIPGKSGIMAKTVNMAMWSYCAAVAGVERKDVEEAVAS